MPLGLDLDRYAAADDRRGELCAELGVVPGRPGGRHRGPTRAHQGARGVPARPRRASARRLPTSQFLVVGDGERRPALETLAAELGLGASVRFLGWRRDLDRVYADAWIVAAHLAQRGVARVAHRGDGRRPAGRGHARGRRAGSRRGGRHRAPGPAGRPRRAGARDDRPAPRRRSPPGLRPGGVAPAWCRPSGRAGSSRTWTRSTRSSCGPRASRCRGDPRSLRLPRRSPAC